MDPDPKGPKTCGSGTLVKLIYIIFCQATPSEPATEEEATAPEAAEVAAWLPSFYQNIVSREEKWEREP